MSAGSDEEGNVAPLKPRRGRGPGRPFEPGHQLSVKHGAFTPDRVEPLAALIIAEQLARPSCPRHLREDPESYAYLLEPWGTAVAICRLLRADMSADNIRAAMTEHLEEDETEVRPAMGAATRQMKARRTHAPLDQLHKYQSQVMHLSVKLGLDYASRKAAGDERRTLDLSLLMEEDAAAEQAELGDAS